MDSWMRCPICAGHDRQSTVKQIKSSCSLDGWSRYFDEEGREHHHHANNQTISYRCSDGHEFTVKSYPECPSCAWRGGETEVRTWDGRKIEVEGEFV